MISAIPLIGGIPAGPELLIILLVLVLLFGANKIPKLARSTGQAMGEFRKGREQVEEELKDMQDGEQADSTLDDEDDEFDDLETETDKETSA
ncbi:twin-arginine translocase TatA/TatE family subunit [Halorubrum ezzemoulense]|jgi:sec-independent protein translocase protein TatA|uniref:Sec-independent protein translocase protein TatA n=1 Tax=Halorubrum ezzemoulense TaxID=337243 RepID=A0A256J837_HALEZ|nr:MULTISPECIES: twin-arginine translocase TatA/TatE family subunit [Halorubrum]MDB2224858.1 twin-arginine translocase TatA/TatE family subunit [Halorubrum ezzemoulense]MDB2237266.1 twin-arginine translocase TatA/TatE family subunit [Halorubrum ezzemoulense]MDB2241744.1 twin-arginine translocase TatA/TatE family subunit [Halorubrum ezzemoulense]MDB2245437.1 twin-arginine translocase TatA/TatE family subunit [Halorubrum ezzemoulense]MDB2246784.1 twin-arginine translocase TatA/TatE family subuni